MLYVALTRAVHALHMIVAPSAQNEKSLHATFSGVVRAALTDGGKIEPQTIAYEHGDPRWFTKTESKARPAAPAVETTDAAGAIRLAPPSDRPSRALQRRSPSQLEGGAQVELARFLRLDVAEALDRGSLVHAWFQEIEWLDDSAPSDESLVMIAQRLLVRGLDLAKRIADFRRSLDQPALRAALCRETYRRGTPLDQATPVHAGPEIARPRWKVWRERPFAIREGNVILKGQFDRLVVLYDGDRAIGADVIDFKTDEIPVEAIAARVENYRPQLDAYRRAAGNLTGLAPKRISARLLFVALGVVMDLPVPREFQP